MQSTGQKILDHLGFANYAHNRDCGISPERYARVVDGDVTDFEARYQSARSGGSSPSVEAK